MKTTNKVPTSPDQYQEAKAEGVAAARLRDNQVRKVKIEVLGGCAYVTLCPADVQVEIQDHDNEKVSVSR